MTGQVVVPERRWGQTGKSARLSWSRKVEVHLSSSARRRGCQSGLVQTKPDPLRSSRERPTSNRPRIRPRPRIHEAAMTVFLATLHFLVAPDRPTASEPQRVTARSPSTAALELGVPTTAPTSGASLRLRKFGARTGLPSDPMPQCRPIMPRPLSVLLARCVPGRVARVPSPPTFNHHALIPDRVRRFGNIDRSRHDRMRRGRRRTRSVQRTRTQHSRSRSTGECRRDHRRWLRG